MKHNAPTFTRTQKLEAVERELRYRRRVYADRVGNGLMTKKKADYEIGVMEALREDLEVLARGERLL